LVSLDADINSTIKAIFNAMTNPSCAILIDGLNSPHGTEMLAMLVACSLRKLQWNVTIFTGHYSRNNSVWKEMLDEYEIPLRHPGFWFLNRCHLPYRVAVRQLWKWCKKKSPQVIWSPTNDMMTCLALETRPANSAPFFVHDPSEASNCPYYPALWYQVCNQVDALSVHGENQRLGALKHYQITKPVEVVYPGSLRPQRCSDLQMPEGVVRFGQFGRMFSCKGTLFAVAALAQVLARGVQAELHFFGDGPFRPATEELAASLGIQENVFMHGAYRHTDLDRLVSNIDVGLMPSVYEGFGLVMLELMSRGRSMIASDVGSSREVLERFNAGIVVPRADPTALADAMECYCKQPELIIRKAANAKIAWEELFTPEATTTRYIDFWRRHGASI
jgi:glycosyltransferase involved in cell wall biosynthesis